MDIRISKESAIPLREQIAAQIEFQVATGVLRPGDRLPSVRALARQLRIHHNTVSQAYRDVSLLNLVSGQRGSRLLVPSPDQKTRTPRPELDDLINQAIGAARKHGYSLQELSLRVQDRLKQESPDHVLVLAADTGIRRLLQFEIQNALTCRATGLSPRDLAANPDLAVGALVVSAPGILPGIAEILPKNRPPIQILYSSTAAQLHMVRDLKGPSIVAVASMSEHFLMVARGLSGPAIGTRHTLAEHLITRPGTMKSLPGDLIFCDAIVFKSIRKPPKHIVPYYLISPECLAEIMEHLPCRPR